MTLNPFSRLAVLAGVAFLAGMSSAVLTMPTARAEPAPASVVGTHPSSVVLPTGEHLSLRWTGDTPHVGRLGSDRSPMSVLTVRDHVYAVPRKAIPYLDRGLDRSLFDVGALAARAHGPVPVTLTYRWGRPVSWRPSVTCKTHASLQSRRSPSPRR